MFNQYFLQKRFRLCGVIFSGLGVGHKYVEIYRDVFRKYLGLEPYPGTLNLDFGFNTKRILPLDKALIIPPPSNDLCNLYVFKALLNNKIDVFVLKPWKTHYSWNILEVISEFNLREKLGLKTGDYVELIFMV
ncbi:MAG: DUF120 domain-containing protein [Desulfurococcaceae archaeon]